jgi:hypothetical protein
LIRFNFTLIYKTVYHTYKKTSSYNVAKGHGNEIDNEKLIPAHRGAAINAQRDKKHVGDGMLKPQGYKRHDGKPDA